MPRALMQGQLYMHLLWCSSAIFKWTVGHLVELRPAMAAGYFQAPAVQYAPLCRTITKMSLPDVTLHPLYYDLIPQHDDH